MQKILLGGASALQLLVLPLVYQNVSWSWQLACGIVMAIAIALARMQLHPTWWLSGGVVFGVLACVGHWLLLPLMLAQIVLAWLVDAQALSVTWRETLWLVQVAFVQVALFALQLQGLTMPVLLAIGLLTVPLLISVWSTALPLWLDVVLLMLIAGVGVITQQLTWLAAIGLVAVPLVSATRFIPTNGAVHAAVGVVLTIGFALVRLHG